MSGDMSGHTGVFVKTRANVNYALEHGTEGAVIVCDLYQHFGKAVRRSNEDVDATLIVKEPLSLFPVSIWKIESIDDQAPPPLKRGRR